MSFPPTPGGRARRQSFISLLLRRFSRSQPYPPSDGVELFAKDRGGRYMPAFLGPLGVDTTLQPFIGASKICLATASGSGSSITQIGGVSLSATGTATTRTSDSTSVFASTRRLGYVPASAANNLATGWAAIVTSTNAVNFRGNAAGRGGFFYFARFGFNALASGNRHMIGFTSASTTTGDPSAASNACFIGKDAADTNWQVMFNDNVSTCTKVDCGFAPVADRVVDVAIFAPPKGGTIQFAIQQYDDTGAVANSFAYTAATDLPITTTFLSARVLSGTGTGTTGAAIDILQAYVETDF